MQADVELHQTVGRSPAVHGVFSTAPRSLSLNIPALRRRPRTADWLHHVSRFGAGVRGCYAGLGSAPPPAFQSRHNTTTRHGGRQRWVAGIKLL